LGAGVERTFLRIPAHYGTHKGQRDGDDVVCNDARLDHEDTPDGIELELLTIDIVIAHRDSGAAAAGGM